MKIALLQCNTVTGDVAGNVERIISTARQAGTAGADLCVTPELALCGVAPGHYLCAQGFAAGCLKALDILAAELKDGPSLLVGAPVPSVYASGLLSNAAVLVEKGGWQVVSRKVYQNQGQNPSVAESADEDARYFDRGISCGIVTMGGCSTVKKTPCSTSRKRASSPLCTAHAFWRWRLALMPPTPLTDWRP